MTRTMPVSLYQTGTAKCVCLSYTHAGDKISVVNPGVVLAAHSSLCLSGYWAKSDEKRVGTTVDRCTECPVSTSAPSVLKRELWHNVHAYYSDSQNILSTFRHLSNIFIKHSHFIVSAEVKVKWFVPAASCGSKKRVCLWNPAKPLLPSLPTEWTVTHHASRGQ